MHEAANRLRLGRVARDAGRIEGGASLRIAADPDGEHRLRRRDRAAVLLRDRDDGRRGLGGSSKRGRHVHHEDGVIVLVVEQRFERLGVARRVGIARDVDRVGARPDWRQRGVERLRCRWRQRGERAAKIRKPINRENTDAATVGENGEPIARKRPEAAERLSGREQLIEIEHAQQARPAERGIVDRVRSGERASMRACRLGALRVAAGLGDQHRLHARGRARRRHEFARVADRFDVKQDRARAAVDCEVVERVAEIDIDAVAERHDRGEADVSRGGPFDEAGYDCTRLRDQREVARSRRMCGETRVEPCVRRHHAEAIRPDEPEPARPRRPLAGRGQRALAVTEAGRDDDGRRGALVTGLRDNGRHFGGRRRDDHEIGRLPQRRERWHGPDAFELRISRIDHHKRPLETRGLQIGDHGAARRCRTRAATDDRDRAWREQLVKAIGRHRLTFGAPKGLSRLRGRHSH